MGDPEEKCVHSRGNGHCASGGAVYGLGFIGAAIYYDLHCDDFLDGRTWFF